MLEPKVVNRTYAAPSLVDMLYTTQEQQSQDRMLEKSCAIVEDELNIEDIIAAEDEQNKCKLRMTRIKLLLLCNVLQ